MRNRKALAASPPRPVKAPVEAAGVVYSENPAAPGLKFFACKPHDATLSMTGCASRWRQAQDVTGSAAEQWLACRGCPIGASHAGEEVVHYSTIYALPICPACRRGTTRMIGGKVCVSCYNRRRELAAGKNARGNAPVELMERPLHNVHFVRVVDGRARHVVAKNVADLFEPVVQALRTSKGEQHFAFATPFPLKQGRLL